MDLVIKNCRLIDKTGDYYIKIDEGKIAEISKTITDSGFIILQFVIQNESLEEYYLSKVDSSADTKNNSKRFKLFRKKGA